MREIIPNQNDKWQQPEHYRRDPEGGDAFDELIATSRDIRIIDPIDNIIDDIAELRHGKMGSMSPAADETRTELLDRGVAYGEWVHFPWKRAVVRYPESSDHFELRTFRNRHLVTTDEQRILGDATIAVFGLSVGSNILDQLAQSGIGRNFILADPDRITPTNLNRIRATMADVGLRKTVVAGRKLSEVDPYVGQLHLENGYTDDVDELLENTLPDVIVEEVDDLSAKARIRRIARELEIPLVMVGDIGERSILDVERYDEGNTQPFNGKLSQKEYEQLLEGDVDPAKLQKLLIKLNGLRNISPRLLRSAGDPELGGFPQLGATAAAGAALANSAIRGILLDRDMNSGTYVANPDKTLRLGPAETKLEAFRIFRDFLRAQKARK